jgi:hypothetical protein
MLKYITSGVAAVGVAVGSYGFGQYHKVFVELNQAQAQVREERSRNADLAAAASNVVAAVSQLQSALQRDQDQLTPGEQGSMAVAALTNVEHAQ